MSCDWVTFFSKLGVPPSLAKTYAAAFIKNRIGQDTLEDLDKDDLREMGIVAIGDIKRILKNAKKVVDANDEVKVIEVKQEGKNQELSEEDEVGGMMARVEATKAESVVGDGVIGKKKNEDLTWAQPCQVWLLATTKEDEDEATPAAPIPSSPRQNTMWRDRCTFKCKYCDFEITSRYHMMSHVKKVHKKAGVTKDYKLKAEVLYKCLECKKKVRHESKK